MSDGLRVSGEFLKFLLDGGRAFVNAKELLEDLSADLATTEVEGSHHTIARIVGHLDYWQIFFYGGVQADLKDYPVHNDDSFPNVQAADWRQVRDSFLEGLEQIKLCCDDSDLLNRSFSQGRDLGGGHDKRSVGETLLYTVALHNAHHYGQIISLRQILGAWPPEAGGVTW